jgi:hypothetical protein
MPARFALCSGAMSRAGKAVAPLVRRAQRLAVVPKRYGSGGAVVNPADADLYAGGMLTGVRSQRGSREYAQRMGWVAILKKLSCSFGVQGSVVALCRPAVCNPRLTRAARALTLF